MQKLILLIFLSIVGNSAPALELFGVDLEKSGRDALRSAAKKSGVILISEGDDDLWFDSYDSSSVLPNSKKLYPGFVKQDKRFAFAEYEFSGFRNQQILRNLRQKYGSSDITKGIFISDRKYQWNVDGIEISLLIDWNNYRTRVSYIEPVALAALKKEQLAKRDQSLKIISDPAVSVYWRGGSLIGRNADRPAP